MLPAAVTNNWRFIAAALGITLELALASIAIGLLLGLLVGLGRSYGGRALDAALSFYVDTMRAIPVLAILVWVFFAAPMLLGTALRPFTAAAAGLGLHLGAYVAEAVRAGLLSVRQGQTRAALALGMTRVQAVRVVVLPQALIRVLPALGSLLTFAVKDTAIAAVIAVPELMRQSQIIAGQTYQPFPIYTAALLIYFGLCFPVARRTVTKYRKALNILSSRQRKQF